MWQHPDYQLFGSFVEHEMALRSGTVSHDILRALDLDTLAQRHPQSLSEGQKRRLVFAATLAADPEVILMDEPFAGQDSNSLAHQVALLSAHCAKHHGAVVLSTHDVRGILGFINRVVWLEHGTIVADTRI